LVEKEGLHSREDGEGEALEHLLEPHLIARPPVDLGHIDNYNKSPTTNHPLPSTPLPHYLISPFYR
jgi:hypothetical protein